MTPEQYEEIFKHLDIVCWNCNASGKSLAHDCDICYGTGYQCTGAGVELLNFLLRQRKRINQTARVEL